jgi:hypothetical protein
MLEHLISLVVVTKDYDALAKRLFGLDDTSVAIFVIQGCIGLQVYCGGCHD